MTKEKTATMGGKEMEVTGVNYSSASVNDKGLTDTASQCLRLLNYLQLNGSVTTDTARHRLGIFCPAPRIKELRQAGYKIETIRYSGICLDGVKRYGMARYVLTIGGGNE